MSEDLKPCPFCGDKPYLDTDGYKYEIGCHKCRYSIITHQRASAIRKWNTRPTEKEEAQIKLEAWQEAFGTTQLTHALARLEEAEKKAQRFRAKKEKDEKS